jgi:hypothetical protein
MKFGYFFIAMNFSSEGAAHAAVQIRPMESGTLQGAGARIDIRVPIRTEDCGLPISAIAQAALASAQQLLPEPALAAWAAQWAGQVMDQPCLPVEALQEWRHPTLELMQTKQ